MENFFQVFPDMVSFQIWVFWSILFAHFENDAPSASYPAPHQGSLEPQWSLSNSRHNGHSARIELWIALTLLNHLPKFLRNWNFPEKPLSSFQIPLWSLILCYYMGKQKQRTKMKTMKWGGDFRYFLDIERKSISLKRFFHLWWKSKMWTEVIKRAEACWIYYGEKRYLLQVIT